MRPRWIPLVVSLSLLAASLPALGDRLRVHIQDEDALLVGEPTDTVDVHLDQTGDTPGSDAGTHKTYDFHVPVSHNRMEVELRYDPGVASPQGPCVPANDLDLYIDGPGNWERAYPGCDDGRISAVGNDVPPGDYTVRVDARQGATVCVPDDTAEPCTAPGVEYAFELMVYDLTD